LLVTSLWPRIGYKRCELSNFQMPSIDDSATGGDDREEHESPDSEWSGASPSPGNLQIREEDCLHVRGSNVLLGKTRNTGDSRSDVLRIAILDVTCSGGAVLYGCCNGSGGSGTGRWSRSQKGGSRAGPSRWRIPH
jgi:hypothetical protein